MVIAVTVAASPFAYVHDDDGRICRKIIIVINYYDRKIVYNYDSLLYPVYTYTRFSFRHISNAIVAILYSRPANKITRIVDRSFPGRVTNRLAE